MITQVLVLKALTFKINMMKTKPLSLLLIIAFISTSLMAQETNIWFDANWNQIDKEKATYYRPAPKKMNNGFWIVDYYMNGTIQMEGFSFNKIANEEKFHGLIKYYFEDGVLYQEVNYKDGEIKGARNIYYESGKLKNKRSYAKGKTEGAFFEYYETGELLEKGNYKNGLREGLWNVFYKNGKIKEEGNYKEGEKKGMWKTFY